MSQLEPIMQVTDLKVRFPVKEARWPWQERRWVKAVDGVSFDVYPGETLGIVGESGCGKSTLARAVLRLAPVSGGRALWLGKDLGQMSEQALWQSRHQMQMIFQDPQASLNPRMTVGDIIAEPLHTYHPELSADEVRQRVKEMMQKVGLLPNVINRYPHEFSGGQCQRIGIARALILKPRLVVCDEPVSALDVSIQAQVVNLLKQVQQEMNLALVFIAHDLSVVKHISDRVMVMYLGRVVETGLTDHLYDQPQHPYTRALLSAVPVPDPKKEREKQIELLPGDLPSPIDPPAGCAFHTRCPQATEECSQKRPELQGDEHHQVACLKVTTVTSEPNKEEVTDAETAVLN
ncbi:murein tripeptide/oligopeptide ABC transporter ATP binding protein OppF [Oceanospirillum sanctuarii]|uniref:murein tripeptide/oligopeptide ABC transporter ATP binding protein OppF n=1 Tax=Oceanospirillum sanctuarii TaxID=1434821 RepID=UPI000A3CDE74|nr:murein tripeptide/oligopeptide ABC transporter ATP binding protein OppF [Oceanospirillum sanctuarii]